MGHIRIQKQGFASTIQDGGRWGYQDKGIAVSGAMDQIAYMLANMLVDNEKNMPCIEMTMLGDTIEFLGDAVIALTGADMQFKVNGKPVKRNQTLYLCSGDVLTTSYATKGMRSYMAIRGGLDIPRVLGSTSTFRRCQLGGFEGRRLKTGDLIGIEKQCDLINYAIVPESILKQLYNDNIIRFTYGNEKHRFTERGIESFVTSEYTIMNESDRMGYRLSGEVIEHTDGSDIISGGINFGSIQVPGNGLPIVMMADHQPTGGYTKIGQVIQADLPKLAQMKPQDKVRFLSVSVDEAISAWKSLNKLITEWYEEQNFDPRSIPTGYSMVHCLYERVYNMEVRVQDV